MVVLVGGKGPSILGFPRGRKFPSVPSLFMSYFFSGNSRGYLYFLLFELIESFKMKVKEVDRTANIAWSPQPQVGKFLKFGEKKPTHF